MEIRPARPDEYATIGELTVRSYRSIPEFETDSEYLSELSDIGARSVDTQTLVAVSKGRVVGAVTYVPGPGTGMSEFSDPRAAGVRALAVDPDLQRRGVGRALTEACIARAAAQGKDRVILHTTQFQLAAHALYKRMQFRREPDLDWQPTPGLLLSCYVFEIDRP